MNIYELVKQTTPGPLTQQGCTVLAKTGWIGDRDPWTLGASEEFHVFSTDENHRSHDEQEANATLLVHCSNNFLRALKALKEGVADFENPDTNATVTWADRAKALIAELEEVET